MKSFLRQLSTRQLVVIGLLIPFCCTLLIGWLQWQAVMSMLKVREIARRTRTVQLGLGIFRYSLSDAESCQFRYILTHNDANLALYDKLIGEARDQLTNLRSLTSDTDLQQKYLNQIDPLFKAKTDATDQSFAMEKAGNHAGALQIISAEESRQNMLDIEAAVANMQIVESQLLIMRQNTYGHNFKLAGLLSVASMALCLGCVVGILFLLRRLSRLQSAVTLGALTEMINYEEGNLTLEEYLKHRHQALATHGEAQIEAERLLGLLQRKSRTPPQ